MQKKAIRGNGKKAPQERLLYNHLKLLCHTAVYFKLTFKKSLKQVLYKQLTPLRFPEEIKTHNTGC